TYEWLELFHVRDERVRDWLRQLDAVPKEPVPQVNPNARAALKQRVDQSFEPLLVRPLVTGVVIAVRLFVACPPGARGSPRSIHHHLPPSARLAIPNLLLARRARRSLITGGGRGRGSEGDRGSDRGRGRGRGRAAAVARFSTRSAAPFFCPQRIVRTDGGADGA